MTSLKTMVIVTGTLVVLSLIVWVADKLFVPSEKDLFHEYETAINNTATTLDKAKKLLQKQEEIIDQRTTGLLYTDCHVAEYLCDYISATTTPEITTIFIDRFASTTELVTDKDGIVVIDSQELVEYLRGRYFLIKE